MSAFSDGYNALRIRVSCASARAGRDGRRKAGPRHEAATDMSMQRWWVDAILDAQRKVDRGIRAGPFAALRVRHANIPVGQLEVWVA